MIADKLHLWAGCQHGGARSGWTEVSLVTPSSARRQGKLLSLRSSSETLANFPPPTAGVTSELSLIRT